ncbi:MAG: M28 family peptidase [bacterium]|nr:M28 family peptidase [bacterium]
MADAGRDAVQNAVRDAVESVREERLREWVAEFSGLRHGLENPEALAEKRERFAARLEGFGYAPARDPFRFRGLPFENVVAEAAGQDQSAAPFLVGAHFDGSAGSPAADDNASGVAALLAVAEVLRRHPPARPVRFVGFDIEEPQDARDRRCRHGSYHFARRARFRWEKYAGVFILESVGYTDPRPGSQRVPIKLPFIPPDAGTFLGVVGTRKSRGLMRGFSEAAARHVPALEIVSYRVPLRGYLVPMTRMSDHAPFWDWGYAAVMLTDTAFLRNPNYHQPGDTPETLDYAFLANVARALIAALLEEK